METKTTNTANEYTTTQKRGLWDGSEVTYHDETVVDQSRARADIEEMVKAACVEKPQAGISFGYIGNLSRRSDDRCWYVWTKAPLPTSHPFHGERFQSVMLGQDFANNADRVRKFLASI